MKSFFEKGKIPVFLSLFVFMAGCMGEGADQKAFAIGQIDETQRFVLNDLDDKPVHLDETLKSNKAVLINFWATWCPPCQEEIPGLIQTQAKYKDKGFTILGVDVGESSKKVSAFAKRVGINYPVLLDKDMKVSESYKVVGIPTSILLDSDGKMLGVYHSYSNALVRDIEKALQ